VKRGCATAFVRDRTQRFDAGRSHGLPAPRSPPHRSQVQTVIDDQAGLLTSVHRNDCAFPSSLSGILQPAPRYSGGTVPAFTGFPIGESLIGSAIPCLSTPDLKYEFFIAS